MEEFSPQIIVTGGGLQEGTPTQELRSLCLNLERAEPRSMQAESPAEDPRHKLHLDLEPAEPFLVHVPRMNGVSSDISDCDSPSPTRPLLNRDLELAQIADEGPTTFAAGEIDRRNEFYCLRRFIFLVFGVPDAPALSSRRTQKCITCFAVPFYAALFIGGTTLISSAVMEDEYIWNERCAEVVPAKIYTILAGCLYLMLGVYWLALLWWSKCTLPSKDTHFRNFSVMALIWWLLCMYFCVVTTGLASEVYEHRDIIVTLGNSDGFVDCAQKGTPAEWGPQDDGEFLYTPSNMIPLWALCSLFGLLGVNLCVCIINAITL